MKASQIIFIAVGTPQGEDGSADLQHVLGVARDIGRAMDGYKVIVNKSTVPVGTAEKVRAIVRRETTHPFSVVSNPEFLKQGAAVDDFMKPDRVVIGAEDPRGAELMVALYKPFTRTGAPMMVMDCASAELCKYAANALLATRISFMNEIANVCELFGADVDRVRQAVGVRPPHRHRPSCFPGVGYGGSCFPKDVKALVRFSADKKYDFKILKAVEAVNELQKRVLVARSRRTSDRSRAAPSPSGGWRSSPRPTTCVRRPAIPIVQSLLDKGAKVQVYDPEAQQRRPRHLRHKSPTPPRATTRCGRRRAGHRHRVAGVPRAGLRPDAQADAHPGDLRWPQHLPAAADEGPRLHLLLDRTDNVARVLVTGGAGTSAVMRSARCSTTAMRSSCSMTCPPATLRRCRPGSLWCGPRRTTARPCSARCGITGSTPCNERSTGKLHGVDLMLAQRADDRRAIVGRGADQRDAGRHRFGMAGGQVVEHDHRMSFVSSARTA